MGFAPKTWTPIYEDNNACIEWGNNNIIGGRERAKHIDMRKHRDFAHEAIQKGHLRLVRVDTSESEQLADILTKGTPVPS